MQRFRATEWIVDGIGRARRPQPSHDPGPGAFGAAGHHCAPTLQRAHASARKTGQHNAVTHCAESSVSQEKRS